ncbi:MAG: Ku protein [Candidatus Dependentiae bacterium]
MKSIWEGSISFGLVSIPVRLYTAVRPHAPGFQLLCAKCKEPVKYKRWCEHCNKEVNWDEIVKGIKLKDGSYFIITQENLKKLKPEKTDTIDVDQFIDHSLIPFIYLENHYYIVPTAKHEKAYGVLLHAMIKTNKVAIGHFVMHERDHVCALSAHENILLLSTLNFAYEIKPIPEIKKSKLEARSKELTLAQQLITQLSTNSFDISGYKNTFIAKLIKAIQTAQAGKKTKKITAAKKKISKPKEDHTLVAALQSSLSTTKKSKKAKKK